MLSTEVVVEFLEIRRLVVVAMFADDWLMERLVLKGGSALALVHGIGGRTSIDVDFSLDGDFEDLEEAKRRLKRSLEDRFDSAGYTVFDVRIGRRPANPKGRPPTWGGYSIAFKVIDRESFDRLGRDRSRRQSLTISPSSDKRTFKIEISKHEYCRSKTEAELDDYAIYVYPPMMIAVEKLRAICQQMPEYKLVRNKRARARDFYDIYCVLTERGLDWSTPENLELVRNVFAAKKVPLELIAKIPEHREYHRADWPAVEASVSGKVKPYDFYFDWVAEVASRLHALWEE
jgi:predicted nucleotidyltransferase component of viral defense system